MIDAERRVHELETIARVSAIITGILNEAQLMQAVAQIVRESFPEFRISIYVLRGDVLEMIEAQRGEEPSQEARTFRIPLTTPRSLMIEAIQSRQSRIIDDIQGEHDYNLLPLMFGAHSEMDIPMLVGEAVIGVVNIQARTVNRFTEGDIRVFKTLVDIIGVAVHNARSYGQARQIAVLEERSRLARELHDSVSQALYGIVLGSQTAQALLRERRLEPLEETVQYVLSLAKAGLEEIRASIFDLRPIVLQERGLIYAVQGQAHILQARHGVEVETDLCDEPEVDFALKEATYYTIREALHNIVKHSKASRVSVTINYDADTLNFDVVDNGVGFDLETCCGDSLGLKSMHERVASLNGEFDIVTAPRAGTHIHASFPVASPAVR